MGTYTIISTINKKAASKDTAPVGNMTGMTHSPGDVAMATSKAEGTGQPHPRSSAGECKDNDNIQKTKMFNQKNYDYG